MRSTFRLLQLVALATILASGCSVVTASSHPFSDPPQKEINASTIASRPPLPQCASSSSSSATCTLMQPSGSSDDSKTSWPSLDASYVGTQWLAPPKIPGTIKARDSYYQIAKLPLSRSSCAPGSEVEARLVFRLPQFEATAEKTQAMAEQSNTAGIMATSNPLAVNKQNGKTRRCVLAGVAENASAAEAAAGAKEAATSPTTSRVSEAKCTECNSFVTTSGDYVRCPAVPGVWYVDRLPLRVPSASAGWCDDGSEGSGGDAKQARLVENEKTLGNNYASFVVNAGSEVEVALFDVVGRSSGPGAPSASVVSASWWRSMPGPGITASRVGMCM